MNPTPPEPTAWDPAAGEPPGSDRVLLCPTVDLFDTDVASSEIEAVVAAVASHPECDFFLCTSRAKRLLALGNEGLRFPPNLWVGVPYASGDDLWRVEDLLRCNTARPWVRIDSPLDTAAAGRLPLSMLVLVVVTGSTADGGLRSGCAAAGVAYEVW